MTKMHFTYAAKMIAAWPDRTEAVMLAKFCADLFGNFNGRFDRSRFYAACGV